MTMSFMSQLFDSRVIGVVKDRRCSSLSCLISYADGEALCGTAKLTVGGLHNNAAFLLG